VESRAEKPIGEIVDLVVDSGGRVRFVVVETDKAFLDINGNEADLRQLPEFKPLSPRPGGAGTGWGIYSAPPGPANQ
jgi:hypothetical protein